MVNLCKFVFVPFTSSFKIKSHGGRLALYFKFFKAQTPFLFVKSRNLKRPETTNAQWVVFCIQQTYMYVCTWMGCTHALMLLSSWHGYEFLSIGLKYRTFSCSQEKKLTLLKKSKHRCVGKSEKGKCCLIMHTVIISWLHGFFHLHGNHLSWESLIISGITTMYLQQNTACTSPLNSIKYLYYCPC